MFYKKMINHKIISHALQPFIRCCPTSDIKFLYKSLQNARDGSNGSTWVISLYKDGQGKNKLRDTAT